MNYTAALSYNLTPFWTINTGASREAKNLQEQENKIRNELAFPVIRNHINEGFKELSDAYQEAMQDNWDSYGAKGITLNTLYESERFLAALPSFIPKPDIAVEPTGDIAFIWQRDADHILALSLSGDNLIYFAGKNGISDKTHGQRIFNDAIPKLLIEEIRQVMESQ